MKELSIFAAFLVLSAALILFPVLINYIAYVRSRNEYIQMLKSIPNEFESSLFVITETIGEGPSRNSDVTFAVAHKNQSFAVNSAIEILCELSEN